MPLGRRAYSMHHESPAIVRVSDPDRFGDDVSPFDSLIPRQPSNSEVKSKTHRSFIVPDTSPEQLLDANGSQSMRKSMYRARTTTGFTTNAAS